MQNPNDDLKHRIKVVLVNELMLSDLPESIDSAKPLFGPDGLGLDSVDALQLVVALDKEFHLKISDADAGKGIMASVDAIAIAIQQQDA